jgi:hypothetical protein
MPKKTVEKKIFSIDELNPKKHYKIKIKSFDKDKKLIGESPWIMFKTTGKNQAPPNVTNLNANFTGSALVVTWNGSAARTESDFKNFRIRISSPNQTEIKNFYNESNRFGLNEDENRDLFGSFEGTINITIYSRDSSGNESSGVSITAYAEAPEDPTNVKLTAAALGYNVSWDLPTFKNYAYTRIYESSSSGGTFTVAKEATGSSTFVRHGLTEVWVKVSHVNKAGAESNLVASDPASITPIDPVPSDVDPPSDPTNLNWEDAGTQSTNGITTASMRAHWQVSDIASGYKVRVTENVVNKENWAVYDVPASKAKVTNKAISSNVATLTLTAHSFSVDDYVTVFNVGDPFNGKHKITSVTPTSISFSLTGSNTSAVSDGDIVISSYTVKELYPGTQYYGAILAYDGANNLTQFVSEGTFTTSGIKATVGSPITIGGTTMAFGPNVDPTATFDGLYINSANFWYNTGYFNVGTTGNSVSWNGTRMRLDGGIVARGGSFSGNVFLIGADASSSISDSTASLIAAPSYDIQSATWSAGVGTVILQSTPSPAWGPGDRIIISQASKDFDNEYTLISVSGNTITFSMSSVSTIVPSVTNTGKVARINKGDRVIFNSFGIQGWENEEVNPVFSLNRDKTSTIGGWTIRPSRIFSGSGTTTVGLSSNDASGVRIWAGGSTPSTAPFRVLASGSIRAYGLFSSSDVDSGTRIAIGSDVDGTKDGIIINDTTNTGIENFWYVPSGVNNGGAYFRVGTSAGSGITVTKTSNNTSKVTIKDYNIEGVTSIVDDSKITINTVEIGKGVGGAGKHGIKIDSSNYWYDPATLGSTDIVFRAGGSASNALTVLKNGTVTFEGTTNPTDGTIKGVLQTTNGFKIGKDVSGTNDGILLNANNYWYVGNNKTVLRVGDAGAFMEFNPDGGGTNIGRLTIRGVLDAASGSFSGTVQAQSFRTILGSNNNYINIFNDTESYSDKIEFVSPASNPGITTRQSNLNAVPANIQLEVASDKSMQSLVFYGWKPPGNSFYPAIRLDSYSNGTNATFSIAADIIEIDSFAKISGPDIVNSGSPTYILGLDSNSVLKRYNASIIGGGGEYQAGNGININTATNPDTISNKGYMRNGNGPTTGNSITYGNSTVLPPSDAIEGDLHFTY